MKGLFNIRPLSASLFKTKSENTYNDVYLIIQSLKKEVISGIAKGSDNTPIWQNDIIEIYADINEEDRFQVQLFDYKLNNGQLIGECEILLQKIVDRKQLLTCYEIKTVTNEIIGQLSLDIAFKQEQSQSSSNQQNYEQSKQVNTEEIMNSQSPKNQTNLTPIINTKQAQQIIKSPQKQNGIQINIQNQQFQQQPQQQHQQLQLQTQQKMTTSIDSSQKQNAIVNIKSPAQDIKNNSNFNYVQVPKFQSDKKIQNQQQSFSQVKTTILNTNQYNDTPIPANNNYNNNNVQKNVQVQQFQINERKNNSMFVGNQQQSNLTNSNYNNNKTLNTPSKQGFQNRPTFQNQQNYGQQQNLPIQPIQQQIPAAHNQQYLQQQQPPQRFSQPQPQYSQQGYQPQTNIMGQQHIPQVAPVQQQMYQNPPRQQQRASVQSIPGQYNGQQQFVRKFY